MSTSAYVGRCGAEVGDGRIQVTIGGEQRTLTIEACTSGDSSSMELTAHDDRDHQDHPAHQGQQERTAA